MRLKGERPSSVLHLYGDETRRSRSLEQLGILMVTNGVRLSAKHRIATVKGLHSPNSRRVVLVTECRLSSWPAPCTYMDIERWEGRLRKAMDKSFEKFHSAISKACRSFESRFNLGGSGFFFGCPSANLVQAVYTGKCRHRYRAHNQCANWDEDGDAKHRDSHAARTRFCRQDGPGLPATD